MDQMEEQTIPRPTAIRAVACAMAVNLLIGSYYAFSNMNPYIAEYLNSKGSHVQSKDTLVILPIWLIHQSLFSIVGVKLSEKIGYYNVNFIAFAGYTIVNGIMIFVENYWVFIIVYGMFTGITVGIGYLPSMYIAWTYFPKSKSVVTGVILFTAGISASIISPITTLIVNPDNKPVNDPEVYNQVPTMFKFLFFFFGVITLVACGIQPKPFESTDYKERMQIKKEEEEARKSMLLVPKPANNLLTVPEPAPPGGRMTITRKTLMDLDPKAVRVYHTAELQQDLKGVVDGQSAILMAHIDTEKVVDLVQHRNTIYDVLREQRKSIRMSIHQGEKEQRQELEQLKEKLIDTNRQTVYRKSVMLLAQECPSVRFGLKSQAFKSIACMAFGCSIVNYFLNSVWKDFYRTKFSVDDTSMALLLSFGGFSNSIARIVAGLLLQRVSFKPVFLVLACTAIFTSFTANLFVNSYGMGLFYLILVFGGIGTQVTIFPTVTTQVFGSGTGPKIYPFVYLCFSIANIAQYLVLQVFNNYSVMFFVFGSLGVAALLVGWRFEERPNWQQLSLEAELKELNTETKKPIEMELKPESTSEDEMEVFTQKKNKGKVF